MQRTLSRFAVVGSVVTAVDILVFLILWAEGANSPWIADPPALAVASVVSYPVHRSVTFRNDPYRRWLDHHGQFAVVAVVGGFVDLIATVALIEGTGTRSLLGGLAAKSVAVALAGGVRWVLHRRVLFGIVRSKQVARPDRPPAPGTVRLSVVLPAYKGEDAIAAVVERVRAALATLDGGAQVIVVDDGSGDRTADVARAAGADTVVALAENRGKGAAVRAGVAAAAGRTVVFTDADLAYAPEQLVRFLEEVEHGFDVVVGSRQHEATTTLVRARRLREVGGRVINRLTHAVVLGQYRDTQCGLKAFRSDAAAELFGRSRIDKFAFDIELFVIAERLGLTLQELPVEVENSSTSTVRAFRDGARVVRDLFRIRRWARQGLYQDERPRTPLGAR